MAGEPLTQDYAAHELFAVAPSSRGARWMNIGLSQSWLAVFLFRLRGRAASLPVIPEICDLLSRALFRVQIGRRVTIGPGLMIPHGNAVIDGATTIGRGCQVNPWVTIGLSNSRKVGFSAQGPSIGDHVHIGTGAKILGAVRIGDYARIGANAVVLSDVPAHATVVGAPARIVAVASADGGGPQVDVARLRAAIVDYRLHRCSLRTLIDALMPAAQGDGALGRSMADHVRTLDLAERSGSSTGSSVEDALVAIDDALQAALTV